MVQEGLFDRFRRRGLRADNFRARARQDRGRHRPMMAATDEVQITVRGKVAMPPSPPRGRPGGRLRAHHHRAADHREPQRRAGRRRRGEPVLDADEPGGAFNVVPESVKLIGTVRSFRPRRAIFAEAKVRQIATKICRGSAPPPRFQYERGYPPTVNAAREAAFAARVGERVFGAGNVITGIRADDGRPRTSPTCWRRGRAPTCSSARAARRAAASCTTRATISTTRCSARAGYLAALVEEALPVK